MLSKRADVKPGWPAWAAKIALAASERSDHPNADERVGACAVSFDRTCIYVGYNGPPAGIDIDWSDREQRKTMVIHAEVNCLRQCNPGEVEFIVVTLRPCISCLTNIAACKVRKVYYLTEYAKDQNAHAAAAKMGIELVHLKLVNEKSLNPEVCSLVSAQAGN